jgi:hypothetical protein
MKPQSAKAKGRRLQQWVRDFIIDLFPLEADDVRSTSMGAGGEDVQLSTAARKFLPIQIECKNKGQIAVCAWYEQAKEHGPYQPVLIIKQDHGEPLAVIDARWFFTMMEERNVNDGSS